MERGWMFYREPLRCWFLYKKDNEKIEFLADRRKLNCFDRIIKFKNLMKFQLYNIRVEIWRFSRILQNNSRNLLSRYFWKNLHFRVVTFEIFLDRINQLVCLIIIISNFFETDLTLRWQSTSSKLRKIKMIQMGLLEYESN